MELARQKESVKHRHLQEPDGANLPCVAILLRKHSLYFGLHPCQRCNTCLQSYLVRDKYCYIRVIRPKRIQNNADVKREVIVHHMKRSKTRQSGIKCKDNLANMLCLVIGPRGKDLGSTTLFVALIHFTWNAGRTYTIPIAKLKQQRLQCHFLSTNHQRILNELLNHPRSHRHSFPSG